MSIFYDEKPYGEFYEEVVALCNLKKGDVFVDLGANLGQEIQYFLNLGIVMDSYEPHPYFFRKLEEDFSGRENLTLNNAAVWDKNEKRKFFFKKHPSQWGDNHRSGGASLIGEKSNLTNFCTEVSCIDIVDVFKKHQSIKILKIDTEGAEYNILSRLIEQNLINLPEFIFFEDHERKINTSEYKSKKNFVQKYASDNNIRFYNW